VYGCVVGMAVVFDASVMSRQESIPPLFVWPAEYAPAAAVEEIDIPVVDLAEFLRSGEPQRGLAEACERHGFFHVVGHGVAPALLAEAYRCMDAFYARPLAEKQRAQRRPGETHGYASSFTGRFDCKLQWKETLSFNCPGGEPRAVADYHVGVLDVEYRHMGYVPSFFPHLATNPSHFFVWIISSFKTGEFRINFIKSVGDARCLHAGRCTRSTATR
jgi:gibberellin-44 dioxygenase